jgi:hypothetical protein
VDIINYEESAAEKVRFSDEGAIWYGEAGDRPEIENQLQELQTEYYHTDDKAKKQDIWSNMFTLVQKYSKSLILKKIKGKKYVEPDEVDDQATQTALAFMSQYIYRPGFHCGASFAGMINPKILETLYKHSREDHHYSLNGILGDTNLELEDMQEKAKFESLYDNVTTTPGDFIDNVDLQRVMEELFDEFDKAVPSEVQRFKTRAYLQILLRKPKNKHSRPSFLRHICNKTELDLINLFELELYQRLS